MRSATSSTGCLTRAFGIVSPAILDLLVEHVAPSDRGTACEVFLLATKARNALAHGALTQADEQTLDGIGHVFAKATQTLVTAGLHHMVKEAAYFIYLNDHPDVHGQHDADWQKASKAIFDRIAAIARQSRYEY